MIKKLKPRSEFSRNVLTLMTGTTIAQAIPVAVSPILTRLYSPDDFGVFALFMSISLIFGSIANGRYELAIMLPEEDEDAFNLAALGLAISLSLSVVLITIVTVFNQAITERLGNEEISLWLYFVPLSVFFIGLYNVLNYFNNRLKNYKDIANANIYKAFILVAVQLSFGFIKGGAAGLVSGQVLSNMFANVKLLKNTLLTVNYKASLSLTKMKSLAIRYKDFPKYSMWAILANTLSVNVSNILISLFYSVSTLGFYSLIQRVLGMPSSLIGGAIGQVFFQQATIERQQTGMAVYSFDTTVKKLLIVALPTFALIFLVVEDLFAFVFGEEWRIAGTYAKIVVPLFMVRFVVASVSTINSVFEKQKISFLWQLVLLILSIGIVSLSSSLDLSFEHFLIILSIVVSLHYLVLFFVVRFVSRGLF